MSAMWLEAGMALLACVSVWLAFQPDTEFHNRISMGVTGVFVAEYGLRLLRARRRVQFVRENIFDLVAILPWDILRGFRFVRLVRMLRVLRGLEVLWRVRRNVLGILRTNGLAYVLAATVLLVLGGGLLIVQVEPGIGSLFDGLWWSLVTTSTVGYGDIAPRTAGGRMIAAVLMVAGIGLLGMVSGTIATYFLGSRGAGDPHVRHLQRELDRWDDLTAEERRRLSELLAVLAGPGARGADATPGAATPEAEGPRGR